MGDSSKICPKGKRVLRVCFEGIARISGVGFLIVHNVEERRQGIRIPIGLYLNGVPFILRSAQHVDMHDEFFLNPQCMGPSEG